MPQHHQSDPRPEPSACSLWQRDVQPCQPMQTNTRVPTHAPRGLAGAAGASDTIRAPPWEPQPPPAPRCRQQHRAVPALAQSSPCTTILISPCPVGATTPAALRARQGALAQRSQLLRGRATRGERGATGVGAGPGPSASAAVTEQTCAWQRACKRLRTGTSAPRSTWAAPSLRRYEPETFTEK